jgi:Spy/CpxP family protein refolding chaperone
MIFAVALVSGRVRLGEEKMSIVKTLAVATALVVGASSLAMAQMSSGSAGSPAGNAASSGGPGTHQDSQKTGSASNTQKVIKNQNGYQGGHE